MNRRSFVFRTLFSAALGIAVRPALSASKRLLEQRLGCDMLIRRPVEPGEFYAVSLLFP
jgi:hypothetical protein